MCILQYAEYAESEHGTIFLHIPYHILHIVYILHILFCVCVRLKKNGKDAKEISLIGQGFQGYIDHLFWYLPFSTAKQAHDMLAKKEMSDEPWIMKRDEIKAEHLLDRAPDEKIR